ncbi:DUF4097 domain-containing protein [Candidatus Latescibacterota bacterium]
MKTKPGILRLLFFMLFTLTLNSSVYAVSKDSNDDSALWGDYLSEEVTVTLEAKPGMKVEIEHSFGNIEIRKGQNSRVLLQGEKRVSARNEDIAREYLDNIELIAETRGNRITIRTRYPDNRFFDEQRNNINNFSLSYTLEIPENTSLEIENSFGNINLNSLSGDFAISNRHGKITAVDLTGDTVLENKFGSLSSERINGEAVISNEHGSIKCTGVTKELLIEGSFGSVEVFDVGADAEISNKHGSLTVEKVAGNAALENAFESLDCKNIGGTAVIRNSHGKVTVRDVNNDVTVNSSFGKIDATEIKGDFKAVDQHASVEAINISGNIDIETSFGSVNVDDIGGSIEVVNQHGSITATNILNRTTDSKKRVNLRTSNSSIRLSLPETVSATVTASTSQGKISCDFPILMNLRDNNSENMLERFSGTIGDGKDIIILENSQGSIRIEK